MKNIKLFEEFNSDVNMQVHSGDYLIVKLKRFENGNPIEFKSIAKVTDVHFRKNMLYDIILDNGDGYLVDDTYILHHSKDRKNLEYILRTEK